MIRLIKFLYVRRVLLVFLFFQVVSFLLIRNNSAYYSAYYFSSSNSLASYIFDTRATIVNYFTLANENEKLRKANAKLQTKNFNLFSSYKYLKISYKNNYKIQQCRVISNSVNFSKNYITIDVGSEESVKPGMGVIAEEGIIGFVKSVSKNYATVTSVLHTEMSVSVNVGSKRELASMSWSGNDYRKCDVLHLPRHVKVTKGDSVYTSGYGGVFPEEILVGIVTDVETEDDKSFHKISAQLINNFAALKNAYVVIDKEKKEKERLNKELTKDE